MNQPRKTIIFLADGMADEPVAEIGGKTPLQAARTPGMDFIARNGRSGTLLTLPEGFPTSSDVANMSVLGCDLKTEFCGRAVLEAMSQGIALGPHDVAFRCNLVTIGDDGRLLDYSGGHISQAAATELIEYLNEHLATERIRFHPGVSYRNLLILSGAEFSPKVHCEKPDDHPGGAVADFLPRLASGAEEGRATLDVILDVMARAAELLPKAPANVRAVAEGRKPANGIWLWSPGRAGSMRTLAQRHGITGAVISAVDVVNGLGRSLGMDVVKVPGATGYIDTNYEGKAAAAIKAIQTHDLVYLHVEAIDEVSHHRDLALKIQAIEDFDSKIVCPVLRACGDGVTHAVLPDHPVPISMGRHTRTPVPVAVCGPGFEPDDVQAFDELAAPRGALGALFGAEFMQLLYPGDESK
ncbi:MAG: cofactor-independent phosphoglycerate mutase [Kiritimatiellia bacterium]|jgi:2,3-bisphosphoglycerate-independent phosphoglycerate mutase